MSKKEFQDETDMLFVRKEAEEDIKYAYEWYEEKQINLGAAFVEEVNSKLLKIEECPDMYMEVMGDVRRALCNKFPYSIYFNAEKHGHYCRSCASSAQKSCIVAGKNKS